MQGIYTLPPGYLYPGTTGYIRGHFVFPMAGVVYYTRKIPGLCPENTRSHRVFWCGAWHVLSHGAIGYISGSFRVFLGYIKQRRPSGIGFIPEYTRF